MKQWQGDRENPDNIKNREELLSKKVKQKQSKKMTVSSIAHWHNIHNFDGILITPIKRDNG